ncbi:hypothetical protein MuYL_3411 [Mucilaginibacter xinganensis]|uniref:Uncharacterized protein n=1 Tax=Mucilaginibacter xinganensis TaxID=1234841 RepID=A0A223NZP1_9SPHI|nr:hypothetical protein MuYL_3411 [Mucilaginibacter xinganensis]
MPVKLNIYPDKPEINWIGECGKLCKNKNARLLLTRRFCF